MQRSAPTADSPLSLTLVRLHPSNTPVQLLNQMHCGLGTHYAAGFRILNFRVFHRTADHGPSLRAWEHAFEI